MKATKSLQLTISVWDEDFDSCDKQKYHFSLDLV